MVQNNSKLLGNYCLMCFCGREYTRRSPAGIKYLQQIGPGWFSKSVSQSVSATLVYSNFLLFLLDVEYGVWSVQNYNGSSPYDMIHIVITPIILPAGLDDTYKSLAEKL